MLLPTIAHHLGTFTCPQCNEPLGRYHAYLLNRPAQILSQLAEHPPAHLGCIEYALENPDTIPPADPSEPVIPNNITCLVTVKAAPTTPSARLVRLPHPETGEPTPCLHLFTPDTLRFLHLTWSAGHIVTRPATPEEIINWMTPALADALTKATTGDEQRTILHQLGLIGSRLPQHERVAFKAHLGAPPPPKLISTWAELAALPETPTHKLEIDIEGCNGWIKSKHPADAAKLGTYLSTHTFYGSKHERSTHELRACGWNVIIANWDAPSAQ